jgi:hypothetical protein
MIIDYQEIKKSYIVGLILISSNMPAIRDGWAQGQALL